MPTIRNIRLKPKLTILFILAGVVPLVAVGWWSSNTAMDALMEKSYAQLESIREVKKSAVERYFEVINHQILTFSEKFLFAQLKALLRGTSITEDELQKGMSVGAK